MEIECSQSQSQPPVESIFAENTFDNRYMKEPNWKLIFFERLSGFLYEDMLNFIPQIKSSFRFFLYGLQYEFGISQEKDLQKSYQMFQEGARLKNSYCLFKLYHIQRYQAEAFGLKKDKDQQMLYLIESSAYFDSYIDDKFEIYPILTLAHHLDNDDPSKHKCMRLLQKYSRMNYFKNKEDKEYLVAYLNTRFDLSDTEKKISLAKLKELSAQGHPPSCLLYAKILKEKNFNFTQFNEIRGYLLTSVSEFPEESYLQLGALYSNQKMFPEAIEYYKKAAYNGCFRSLYELGCHFYAGKYIEQDYEKGIDCFLKAFYLGYFFSADHLIMCLRIQKLKQNEQLEKKFYEVCRLMALSYYKYNDFSAEYCRKNGPQYYILAFCYMKGYGFEKNLNEAKKLLLQALSDENVKEKKYILCKLGKIYKNQGETELAKKYFEDSYNIYKKITEQKRSIVYPVYFYRLGVMYLKGYGVQKNIILAYEHFQKSLKYDQKFYFIQCYFQEKAQLYINQLQGVMDYRQKSFLNNQGKVLKIISITDELFCTCDAEDYIKLWHINKEAPIAQVKLDETIHEIAYESHQNILLSITLNNLRIFRVPQLLLIIERPIPPNLVEELKYKTELGNDYKRKHYIMEQEEDLVKFYYRYCIVSPNVVAIFKKWYSQVVLYDYKSDKIITKQSFETNLLGALYYQSIILSDCRGSIWFYDFQKQTDNLEMLEVSKGRIKEMKLINRKPPSSTKEQKYLLTCFKDYTVKCINLQKRQVVLQFSHESNINRIQSINYISSINAVVITNGKKMVIFDENNSEDLCRSFETHVAKIKRVLFIEKYSTFIIICKEGLIKKLILDLSTLLKAVIGPQI